MDGEGRFEGTLSLENLGTDASGMIADSGPSSMLPLRPCRSPPTSMSPSMP